MKETLIFDKIQLCWKKSMETEAVFTKSEMNNERNVDKI